MSQVDSKKLMKMDRLHLMELLQNVTQENEKLKLRVSQLEEANAKLTLSAWEADFAQKEAEKEAERLRSSALDVNTLPTGSFAEAMVQTYAIVEKTQQAADEYLNQAKETLEKAQQEAERLLDTARTEAEALTAEAQTAAEALTNEAAAHKARMEEKFAGISARLHAEMQQITTLMQGMNAEEEAEE